MSYLIVSNRSAGSTAAGIVERALRALPDADRVGLDGDLGAAIRAAVAEDRVVVAGGGDGTVNAVIQHLGGGTLGVLPGGTLNHFARDLGVGDEQAAIEALRARSTRRVDVGVAGDRRFVNTVSLGVYPEFVRERERHEGRVGRWLASLRASGRALRAADPLTGDIAADGDRRRLAAWLVFVGNNRFDATPVSAGDRARLDGGVLDVRVLQAGPRSRLALSVAEGRARGRRHVRTDARRVDLRLDRPHRVAVDGEVLEPVEELTVNIEPAGLRVVAPAG